MGMKLTELKPAQKYHRIGGKYVPVDIYDTDVLLRLILKLSKRCNKFGLKHTKSVDIDDGGVWVARGFVNTQKSKNGSPWEISVMDNSPLIAAEKFLTMLTEHEEKYNVHRQKLDTPSINSPKSATPEEGKELEK